MKTTGKTKTAEESAARRNKAGSRAAADASRGGVRTASKSRPKKKKGKKTGTSYPAKGILDRTERQNSLSLYLAFLVVAILVAIVAVNSVALRRRLQENMQRAQLLRKEIQNEQQRTADIEEYRRYTATDAYIEEVAREKLGLIYEGEMVFKEEK